MLPRRYQETLAGRDALILVIACVLDVRERAKDVAHISQLCCRGGTVCSTRAPCFGAINIQL